MAVNFSGCCGRPPKKPLFARDNWLAQDGARLMTGPFANPACRLLLPLPPLLSLPADLIRFGCFVIWCQLVGLLVSQSIVFAGKSWLVC